jgi:uncharacterized protein YfaS (alpha-2-macroglobulin family)
MRKLDAPADRDLPNIFVKTQEGRTIEGRFRFLGTRGLLFKPAETLPGATRFVLTVPAGTTSSDGAKLAVDYTLEFATARPALSMAFPADRPLRPKESVYLQFSLPVDPLEVASRLELIDELSGKPLLQAGGLDVERGAPDWAQVRPDRDPALETYDPIREISDPSGRWVKVTPKNPLPLDVRASLVVGKGLLSKAGPLRSDAAITMPVRTLGPLRLVNATCARQNLGRCEAHRDIAIVLSNPVAPEEFRRFLVVNGPKRDAKPNTGTKPKKVRFALEHALRLDPDYGDTFRVTLRAGMTDAFGQKLERDVSVELAVEEPYRVPDGNAAVASQATPPSYQTSDGEAVTDAAATTPRRPRLKYELELGLRGHVVESSLASSTAGSGKIPVSAINVPTYGLHTQKLPEIGTIQWLNGRRESTAFLPFEWISPQVPTNTRSVRRLDVRGLLGGKTSGAAVVSLMGLGELSSNDTIVNVTDLGISAKMSRFGSLVWVTRLSSGEPVREAVVNVYDRNGQVVSSKTTDPLGMASFGSAELRPIGKHGEIDAGLLLVARANEDFAFQRLVTAHSRTGAGEVDYAQKAQWVGLVFTDRSVYRPGETVKAGGFFRQTAEQGLTVRPGQAFEYSVRDSQGEVVGLGESKLDAFGALAADVNLGKAAAYGQASLTVQFGRNYGEQFSVPFEILAYKAAEFKVGVEAKRSEYVHRERATFTIHAEYLYGAPVSEGRVQQYVTRQEVDFVPPNSAGFVVDDQTFLSDLHFYPNRGTSYSQQASVLDAQGQQQIELALDAPEQARPENLTFEAEVVELSEQAQSGRSTVLVHPAQFYLGLKAPKSRFLAVGAPLPVEVAAIRPNGERVNGVTAKLELFRRNWTSTLEDRPTDSLYHRTHIRDELRGHCQVTAGANAAGCHLRLEEPGYYVLRTSSVDPLGNPIKASLGVYAVNNKADEVATPVAFSNEDRRGLSLELDRPTYQPGDVAKVLVKSPFKEATALVTVERGGIFERRVEKLRGAMPVIEIPIVDAYYPNAYVSVHLLRGRVAKMPAPGSADVGAPDYRIGYARLLVDPEARRLRVQVTPSSKEFRPGDDVEARVALLRPDGKPTRGTLTFYVVDEGVLRLTGYKTPDPLPAFAGLRPLGVFPVESRDYLAKFLAYRDGERISPLGFEFKDSSNDKGDEVGGGDLPGRLRSDFRTTVYFESGRAVGEDGTSNFRFRLPDNLTSFRLMAVAAGDGDRFGFGEEAITTYRRLMARPALPRMMRVGDRLEAGVVVSSKGMGQTDVDVTLDAKGVTLVGPKTQRVLLKSQGQAEVRFAVVAAREGEASFEFAVRGGGETDRVRVSRKIEQPIRFLSAATYGTTNKSMSVGFGNLEGIRKDQGELRVSLSNSALVGVRSVFEELANYPYGCTEQLTSRALPLLMAPKLAALENVKVSAFDREAIDSLLGQIAKRQNSEGNFGFWDDDSAPNSWLSAYALLALEIGSRSGYFIPKQLRDRTASYLTTALDQVLSTHSRWDGDPDGERSSPEEQPAANGEIFGGAQRLGPAEQKRKSLGEAAFVADILARTGQLDESRLRRLLNLKGDMALSSKIQLLHAMAKLRLPRKELDALHSEVMKQVTNGPAEARVESTDPALAELLDSTVRSTAILLESTLLIDTKHSLGPKLARGLLRMRAGAAYRNPHEDAWALLALEEYRKVEARDVPDFAVEVFLSERSLGSFAFRELAPKNEIATASAAQLLADPSRAVAIDLKDPGTVHYAVELKVAKEGASLVPMDEGLSVEKLIRAVDPSELPNASKVIAERSENTAQLGQLILVDLLVESAEARRYVVIDDPLPAGFEPIELAFKTTAQALAVAEGTPVSPESQGWQSQGYGALRSLPGIHREMRDERVLFFLPEVPPGIYHFRYLARATSPGTFLVPPTRAECMYDPEVFGQSRGTSVEIQRRNVALVAR